MAKDEMFRLSAMTAQESVSTPAIVWMSILDQAPLAAIAATKRCPGTFETEPHGSIYRFKETNLTVSNLSCAAGEKVARKLIVLTE